MKQNAKFNVKKLLTGNPSLIASVKEYNTE